METDRVDYLFIDSFGQLQGYYIILVLRDIKHLTQGKVGMCARDCKQAEDSHIFLLRLRLVPLIYMKYLQQLVHVQWERRRKPLFPL